MRFEIAKLKSIAESCSRQLRAWADSLQNSDIKGQRHLTVKTREADESRERAEALDKRLLRNLPAGHPKRREAEERGLI